MKNAYLRLKSDYQKQLQKVERIKAQLISLERETDDYNKKLKKLIGLVIFTKAHAYCLDNEKERKKLTNIIYDLLSEIRVVRTK